MQNLLTGQEIKDEELRSLSDLALKQLDYEQMIERKTAELDKLQEGLRQLSTITIPDKMNELGLAEFKLSNGWKVQVKPFYSASIVKEEAPGAIKWLEDNKMGGVIKREINVPIDKGDSASTKKIESALNKLKIFFEKKEGVHAMTLKALFKEQSEAGKTLPDKYFKTFVGNITKITATK